MVLHSYLSITYIIVIESEKAELNKKLEAERKDIEDKHRERIEKMKLDHEREEEQERSNLKKKVMNGHS